MATRDSSSTAAQENCPDNTATRFRTVPNFLLQTGGLHHSRVSISIEKTLILGTLYHSGKDGVSKLSNKEIAERSGLKCNNQSIRRQLDKLEEDGWIKRIGVNQLRTIRLLFSTDNDSSLDLNIPPEIFNHPDLNSTQKLILTAIKAFPKATLKWLADRLEINYKTIKNNLTWLRRFRDSGSELFGTPLGRFRDSGSVVFGTPLGRFRDVENPNQTHEGVTRDANQFGRGIDTSRYSLMVEEDSRESSSGVHVKHEAPERNFKNLIPLQGDRTMSTPPPNNTPSRCAQSTIPSHDWEGSDDGLLREQCRDRVQKTYSTRSVEVDGLVKFTNLVHHKLGTKAYHDAYKVIRLLRDGPGKKMSALERQHFIQVNENGRMTRPHIEKFLDRGFSLDERKELYRQLDYSCSAACNPHPHKMAIAQAFRNINGFSRLLQIWYFPPKPLQAPTPVSEDLQKMIQIIKEAFPDTNGGGLYVLRQFKDEYARTIRPRLDREGEKGWQMVSCLHDLIDFSMKFNEKYPITGSSVGWLRPGSITYQAWMKAFWQDREADIIQRNQDKRLVAGENDRLRREHEEDLREAQEWL